MKKWLAILAIVWTFAIPTVAAQNHDSGNKNKTNSQEVSPPTPEITNNQATTYYQQSSDEKPKGWHKFVAFPEGITAWLVMFTLGAIVWQSWETRKAAEATVSQAKHSERTTKQQLRAYLGISHAVVTITPQGEIKARVDIENGGQTPANDVQSWSHAIIAPYPSNGILKPPPPGMPQGVSVIPSKRVQHLPTMPLSIGVDGDTVLETLKQPRVALFVHGRVEYRDVFRDSHFLNFQLIVGGPAINEVAKDGAGNYMTQLSMDTEGNEGD